MESGKLKMMNMITALNRTILIFLCWTFINPLYAQNEWKTHIDTSNSGFTIAYKYPSNFIAEDFEDSRCLIGTKQGEWDSTVFNNTMIWCLNIVGSYQSNMTEENIWEEYRNQFDSIFVKQSDNINIADCKVYKIKRVMIFENEGQVTEEYLCFINTI